MITIKQLPFIDKYLSVSAFFQSDTKANLQNQCDALDIYLPARLSKANYARSLGAFFEQDPLFYLYSLPGGEQKMINELLSLPSKECITHPMNLYRNLKMQDIHLVATYEDADSWHLFMPDCIRRALREALNKTKEPEVNSLCEMVDDLPDFVGMISNYPVRTQAAIFLILESLNVITFSTLPINNFPSYYNDYKMLVEAIVQKKSDEELRVPIFQLMMALKSSLDELADSLKRCEDCDAHTVESNVDLIGYGTLLHALHAILLHTNKLSKSEVAALLNNYRTEKDRTYFNSIDSIAADILSEVVGNLSRFVEESDV